MCGIFGYYNFRVPHSRHEILECLLTGLRRLEYRGYDSAGVCLDMEPAQLGPEGAASGALDGSANGSSADGAAHGALQRLPGCAGSSVVRLPAACSVLALPL